jgi:hypothetical protein
VFEQCLETGDIDILRAVHGYREGYLEENFWMALSEKYAELYLQAASDIDHPYIDLVRLVHSTPALFQSFDFSQVEIFTLLGSTNL